MSLPTAVATGIQARPDDAIVPVKPLRVAIGAGVLAALYLLVLYLANPVPGRFIRLAGGSGDEVGRHGGVRLVWQPPLGVDLHEMTRAVTSRGTRCHEDSGRLVIELAGVTQDEVEATAAMLTQGGLEFREVIESEAMGKLARTLGLPMRGIEPVDVEVDQWRPDEGGGIHTDYYVIGSTRAAIEDALARGRAAGWSLPPGTHVAYEHVVMPDAKRKDYWRTYVVSDQLALDGNAVANAVGSYDPNTNRPVVLLDFTRAGAGKFAELTTRIAGHKLASLVGGIVKSAPIINGPIRGGRASITMGGSDPMQQERERDALVKTLAAGALPAGGTVLSNEIVPPTDGAARMWLARGVLVLGGGALVGLFAWILVRVTRPVRRRALARATGPWPVSRIFVMLLAPAAVLALSYLPVPMLDRDAFVEVMHRPARDVINLGSIGLTPLVAAYLLANLVRTIRRRAATSGQLVAVLAILFTGLQAWTLTTYLQSFPGEELVSQTPTARLTIVIAFGAATAALAGVAALVRAYGLGNGYAALIAGGWLVLIARAIASNPPLAPLAVMLAELVAIAVPVAMVLRWRVYGAGEPALRVPSSGIVPVSQAGGIAIVLAALSWADLGALATKMVDILVQVREHAWLALAIAAVLVVAWSAAFAWPRSAHVSWASWRRATLVSLGLVVAAGAVLLAAAQGSLVAALADPVLIAVTTAVVLDAYDGVRAHRVELERVGSVHSAHLAEQFERQLRDAGIPCHLAGSHVRTILGGFGGFAPIDVLVPREHEAAARTLLSSD